MPSQQFIEFFLNADSCLIQFECVEIAHPSLSQTYRFVRNSGRNGINVDHNDGSGVFNYSYLPMKITPKSRENNLDFGLTVTVGDVGETLAEEIRRIESDGTYSTPPTLTYRTYRSDNLTAPMYGAFVFNVYNINLDKKGASLDCATRKLNTLKTGEFYDPTSGEYEIVKSFI
jgi:hypothetical protein